jgi:hypothetical protein
VSERPLKEWIVEAFHNLGRRVHLRDVYEEVRRLGYDRGGKDLHKLIRSRIYEHSSDSDKFNGNPNDDLFRCTQKRSGIWELRAPASDVERVEQTGNARDALSMSESLPDEEADRDGPNADTSYVPQEGDRRKVVERQIRERRGQRQFRDALRERYGDCCLVTGCEVLSVLEAAHISPYRGEDDNHPANGLLLRADVHTLFDLDLLGIEPEELRVELHRNVVKEYGCFANVTLRCGNDQRPAREALGLRYELFRRRLRRP